MNLQRICYLTFLLAGCNNTPSQPLLNSKSITDPVDSGINHDIKYQKNVCAEGMIHISGDYCEIVIHKCLTWLDPPMKNEDLRRCSVYAQQPKCASDKRRLDFCIDFHETKNAGDDLPMTDVSWQTAKIYCENNNKRLCLDEEWTFACEGEEMRPYPYGFVRSTEICYTSRLLPELVNKNGDFVDLRQSIHTHPNCLSAFGVHNMVGNVDEWVFHNEASYPFRSGLKGGWWAAGLRSRCRPMTTGHDEHYKQVQIGIRCCSDLKR